MPITGFPESRIIRLWVPKPTKPMKELLNKTAVEKNYEFHIDISRRNSFLLALHQEYLLGKVMDVLHNF